MCILPPNLNYAVYVGRRPLATPSGDCGLPNCACLESFFLNVLYAPTLNVIHIVRFKRTDRRRTRRSSSGVAHCNHCYCSPRALLALRCVFVLLFFFISNGRTAITVIINITRPTLWELRTMVKL